jgi:hypothetical protein
MVTRRFFLLSSAAWSAGCAMRRPTAEAPTSAPIRQPAVGQTWRYSKQDLFTHALLFDQVDRVASVGATIAVDSNSEAITDGNKKSHWGAEALRKYFPHHDTPVGALPGEIQNPWGKIWVDPHWSQVQVYETAIPLWPEQMQPGWETRVSTQYKTPQNQDARAWDQTMKAHSWEKISVPAGRFNALRFTNQINFVSGDTMRSDSKRQETLWFAPEVGRWVARESKGSYFAANSAIDTPYNENGYRWELLEWS